MRKFFLRFSSQQNSSVEEAVEQIPSTSSPPTLSPSHNGGSTQQDQQQYNNEMETSTSSAEFLPESTLFTVEFASDPTAWELELDKSWAKLDQLMRAKYCDRSTLNKVHKLLTVICHLLVMEVNSQSEPSIGPILDAFFNEEILLNVQRWALKIPSQDVTRSQMILIRLYEFMVVSSQCPKQSVLVHKPILIPLLQLLQWCRKSADERLRTTKAHRPMATAVDRCFVRLINQICRKIAEESTLVHFFFHSSVSTPRDVDIVGDEKSELEYGQEVQETPQPQPVEEQPEPEEKPFLVFDLLVPYLYAPEDVGQFARDALILIMSVSKQHQFVADYVAQKSNFCPVLAAGLSGCFSQLPHCVFSDLGVDADEFHKLSVLDVKGLPELYEFHNALLFCNAVAGIAHESIVRQIARFFYAGFLLEVFKSSVLESDSQELCSRIVYFHLCVDTIRAPPLVRALVKVLLVAETNAEHEGWNLLEVLLSKMNTSDRLCRVTLSLLHTLLELHCEDLLWCAVFRHLLPYIPLNCQRRQRHHHQSRRFDANVSLNAASFFLECVPQCTRHIKELYSEEQFAMYLREAEDAVQDCTAGCARWCFKYDGVSPNLLLNITIPSEEQLSSRQPFVRLNSARSSFASTGWNRYFQNRSAHGTLLEDGSDPLLSLNELGKEAEEERITDEDVLNRLNNGGTSSSQEDFSDFNPQYETLHEDNGHRLDYFQFAYEGVSESDDPDSASSRRNSRESGGRDGGQSHRSGATDTSESTAPELSARSRMMDAIMAIEWSGAHKSRDQFIALLDSLPTVVSSPHDIDDASNWPNPKKSHRTVEENIALIESRWQYLEELRKERAETVRSNNENNPFRLDLSEATMTGEGEEHQSAEESKGQPSPSSDTQREREEHHEDGGFPLECIEDMGAGILLESVFEALSRLPEHSFPTNLQLVAVLHSLFSFPQPVLTTYLLYVDTLKSRALCRITNLISDLKDKIDAFAQSGDDTFAADFEQLLGRAVRHRQTRAERAERHHFYGGRPGGIEVNGSGSARSTASSNGFHFTHRAMASAERGHLLEEQERQMRNFAYAAIVHSQLCQLMAAFALQHSTSNIVAVAAEHHPQTVQSTTPRTR